MIYIVITVAFVAVANLALLLRLNWMVDKYRTNYAAPRAEIDSTVIEALDRAAVLAQTVAHELKENLAVQREEFRRTVVLVDEIAAQLSSLIASEAIAKRHRTGVADALVDAQAEVDAVAGNLVDAKSKVEGVADALVTAKGKVEGVASDLSAKESKAEAARGRPDGAMADAASPAPRKRARAAPRKRA